MTKRKDEISRPDRRIAAQIETLAFLFDVSVGTIERAVETGKLLPSNALGPKLYRVDDVEKAIFGGGTPVDAAGSPELDHSVAAVHAQKKDQRRGATP